MYLITFKYIYIEVHNGDVNKSVEFYILKKNEAMGSGGGGGVKSAPNPSNSYIPSYNPSSYSYSTVLSPSNVNSTYTYNNNNNFYNESSGAGTG